MATHSRVLAWRIPWTEGPGGLQTMGLQSRTWLSSLRFHFHFTGENTQVANKNVKRYSISLFIWRMKIKTIMRNNYTSSRMPSKQAKGKQESIPRQYQVLVRMRVSGALMSGQWEVKWSTLFGKLLACFSWRCGYLGPKISLLVVCPRKRMWVQRTCTRIVTTWLLIKALLWRLSKCLLIVE